MFNYLKGIITEKAEDNRIVLEVNNIGYEIYSDNELYNCEDEICKACVVLVPGEDEFRLYGFKTEEKRKLFNLLRSVSGLGSKSVIKILSSAESLEIIEAISFNDTAFLKSLPGVGKKTAERLVLELKSKMKDISENLKIEETKENEDKIKNLKLFQEALEGLEVLGYSSGKSRQVLRELMEKKEDYTVQKLIKDALKKFLEIN
ncbi:MAG: Holliday junction branch migration protein RuvA [Thermotogota bacterium]|nr:Holliday junction branch migration protein RuvA [Thermotogota bacterium]